MGHPLHGNGEWPLPGLGLDLFSQGKLTENILTATATAFRWKLVILEYTFICSLNFMYKFNLICRIEDLWGRLTPLRALQTRRVGEIRSTLGQLAQSHGRSPPHLL